MPNLYVTPLELKAAMPDAFRATTIKYDAIIMRLAGEVSRWIEQECKRSFYPTLATRYFSGSGAVRMLIPDLVSVTSISTSADYGLTYTALTASDYYGIVYGDGQGDYNGVKSYNALEVNLNSTTLGYWPRGQRMIKIVGVWGYTDDRDNCFQLSGDTVQDNPLSSSAVTLTVSDVDAKDSYGAFERIQAGNLLRAETEYIETALTANVSANTIGVLRGRNGSTAAAHVQGTALYVWRVPEPVKQAAVIQATRELQRGLQGFGDARANPELGELIFFKSIDPEAAAKLAPYRRLEIP